MSERYLFWYLPPDRQEIGGLRSDEGKQELKWKSRGGGRSTMGGEAFPSMFGQGKGSNLPLAYFELPRTHGQVKQKLGADAGNGGYILPSPTPKFQLMTQV